MLTLSSQTWTAWHPKQLAATASRTAYILKAGSQSCYEKMGLPGINKIIEGYHSKMNMFAEYVGTLSLFSQAMMLKWKAFLLEGFVCRCRSFPKPSLKGWRPMLEEQGWSSLWVHCWLQGLSKPQNHQGIFQQIVYGHFFVGSRAALCLVRWRVGHLRFGPQIARVRSIIVEN